jgi:hypothetical protein
MGQKVGADGLLNEPHPINKRSDVNRAKVLPLPRAKRESKSRPSPSAAPDPPAPAGENTAPQSGFDYVMRRNRMMKSISGRARSRSATRRA